MKVGVVVVVLVVGMVCDGGGGCGGSGGGRCGGSGGGRCGGSGGGGYGVWWWWWWWFCGWERFCGVGNVLM